MPRLRSTIPGLPVWLVAGKLAICAGGAGAQEPLDTIALDSLTVTVLRGRVDPRLAPFAITVLDRAELTRGRSPTFFTGALTSVPGLQVQNRFNFAQGERLSVRGYGARAQFGVRGVKVLVDGIPATLPDGQTNLDVVDLASVGRVEVLRGAAAALYGNAAGGVLLFRTRPPAATPLAPEMSVVAGSHGLRRVDGSVSGTLGRTGYIVSAGTMNWTGFRTLVSDPGETYGSADRTVVNAQLLRPLGRGALRVMGLVVDQSGENPGSIPPSFFDTASHAWANNVRQRTGESSAQRQIGVAWSGPVAGLEGETAGWLLQRDTHGPIPTSILDLQREGGGLRGLVRGRGARWSWDLGGSLERQRDSRRNFANELGEPGALTLDQLETVTGVGVFAQVEARLGARLHTSVALRWDGFDFGVKDRLSGAGDPDDSGARRMSALAPSLGVLWEATPRVQLFANVASALETPTTTELANRPSGAGGFNPELQPARGRSIELGLRGAHEGLRYEAVAFRAGLRDQLVAFEVPEAAGRTFYRNAGSSAQSGFELSVDARPLPWLRAQLSHSRVIVEFDRYVAAGVDLRGKRLPGLAPTRWSGAITVLPSVGFVELAADWTDRIPVDDANTTWAPSHTLLELRAGIDLRAGPIDLGVFTAVHNLADRRYVSSVVVNAFGSRWFEPGPGRSWQIGVRSGWSERRR